MASNELPSEDKRSMPDKVWVGRDAIGGLMIYPRLPDHRQAIEYMRVLSRQEVDKIAGDGIDVQQYINSLLRTIEGQRRHIARLENPSAHVAAGVTGHD
jgi:hypothetical protein